MRGHAGDELERTQPEAGADIGIERLDLPRRKAPEEEVERAAHAHGSVDQLGHERAVAGLELLPAQQFGQKDVRVGTVIDTHERLDRERAWISGRSVHAGSTRASERTPVRQAAAGITRLPSGCTSSSTSAPAVVTSAPSGVIIPGSRPSAAFASQCARHTLTRRSATRIHAPGRGLPARTTRSNSRRRPGGIELELLDGELLGVGRLSHLRLGNRGRDLGKLLDEELRADADQAVAQLARGVVLQDRNAARRVDGPGVEPGLELHHAHAGLGVAREDRPLDRRRAPPARQQREVHVDETVWQRFEQGDRKQLAERDDHAELGTRRAHVVDDLACFDRRANGQSELLGRAPNG